MPSGVTGFTLSCLLPRPEERNLWKEGPPPILGDLVLESEKPGSDSVDPLPMCCVTLGK